MNFFILAFGLIIGVSKKTKDIMQVKIFRLIVCACWFIGVSHMYGTRIDEIVSELKILNVLGERYVKDMKFFRTSLGRASWNAAFMQIRNSRRPYDAKLKTYALVVELGILHTSEDEEILNETIREKLQYIEGNKDFAGIEGCPSYDDLKREFEARSNPSSPVTSGESSPRD